MRLELPFTAREYSPNLCMIRKAIALDRSTTESEILVSDGIGDAIILFVRHSDLYVTGLDFGMGRYRFANEAPAGGLRRLEFAGDYVSLGLHGGDVSLDAYSLVGAIRDLRHHRPGPNGSNFFAGEKRALIRLIFVTSEALRFWTIHQSVLALLQSPGTSLRINDFAGDGKPLNSWGAWSKLPDWPGRGVFMPGLPAKS